jgi:hypothetical protein
MQGDNLMLMESNFDIRGFYTLPIPWDNLDPPGPEYFAYFDQEGYDLSKIEILFAIHNDFILRTHRKNHTLSKQWFIQHPSPLQGAILNHGLLFERKGFAGKAMEQIKEWSKKNPLFYSLIKMQPKWGVDLSIDFYSDLIISENSTNEDREVFEVFHYEWDSFKLGEAVEMKQIIEDLAMKTDFNIAGQDLLTKKNEWYPLDYFQRSKYRTDFYGIPIERFKMVPWL